MSSFRNLWDLLSGRRRSRQRTDEIAAAREAVERDAREREIVALDSAAESSGDERLHTLAAERRSQLKEAEDFHRALGG